MTTDPLDSIRALEAAQKALLDADGHPAVNAGIHLRRVVVTTDFTTIREAWERDRAERHPGWKCSVCGYMTFDVAEMRENIKGGDLAVLVCPVCKAVGEFVNGDEADTTIMCERELRETAEAELAAARSEIERLQQKNHDLQFRLQRAALAAQESGS